MCMLSCTQLFVTPWTVAHQAPLSMGFSRQENWSGLPFPLQGDLPDPGIKPKFLYWQSLPIGIANANWHSLPLSHLGPITQFKK